MTTRDVAQDAFVAWEGPGFEREVYYESDQAGVKERDACFD
jgi:hypothetical protein